MTILSASLTMDNVRLLLRYAIPGWLVILFYAGYEGIRCTLRAADGAMGCIFASDGPARNGALSSPTDLLVFLTTAGVAGIPVGYAIYQLYQAQFHRLHLERFPIETAPHVDRGHEALRLLPYETRLKIGYELQLFAAEHAEACGHRFDPLLIGHALHEQSVPILGLLGFRFVRRGPNRWPAAHDPVDRTHFPRRQGAPSRGSEPADGHDCNEERCPKELHVQILMNWASATYVWFRIVSKKNLQLVEDRANGLSDVFHSLGASRWGAIGSLPLALATAFYDKRFTGLHVASEAVAFAVLLVAIMVVVKIFNSARRSTQYSLLDFYRNFITAEAPTLWR